MSDPLSYFAGEGSSSSDSDEESGEQEVKEVPPEEPKTDKLPPPDSLFATVGKPSFLYDPSAGDVDWDKLVKNNTAEAELNVHSSDGRYAAIAPPSDAGQEDGSKHNKKVHSSLTAAIVNTYSTTSGEISAPPVRYTTKDVDPKFRTVSDRPDSGDGEGVVGKRDHPSADSSAMAEPGTSKKQKLQNFRQKEKRKRDEGQSSRGKSYVEEEKRILRQDFSTDEVMS